VDLTDEAVDVDDQAPAARSAAGRPGTPERLAEHPVELAHVPEGERPQERPQCRRRRDAMAQHSTDAPRAHDVAVIDRIGPQQHRRDQRHHLRPGVGGCGPPPQAHAPVHEALDPQPHRQRRHQHDPGIGDRPALIEANVDTVQSDRPVIVHHEGDLLTRAPTAHTVAKKPCSGGHSSPHTGQNHPATTVDRG
jgi:hypothetical protein